MKIIFNADDFGYSKGVNIGILEAYSYGLVRSTTMIANMPGFNHAVELGKLSPDLKVGVHLVLTAGASLGGQYKTITDEAGYFINQKELSQRAYASEIDLSEVEKEYTLQINKILATGLSITHFDGHHHSQCLPGIIDVFLGLAKKYGVAVRDYDSALATVDLIDAPAIDFTFYGETATINQLEHILSTCTENTEIMCHPAYLDNFLYNNSTYNIHRMQELEILTSKEAKMLVAKYGHSIASFANLY